MPKVNKNKLYNAEIKQQFLDTITEPATNKMYTNFFKRIGTNIEGFYRKDISEFSDIEFRNIIGVLNLLKYSQVREVFSIINRYLAWMKENNHIENDTLIDIETRKITIKPAIRKCIIKDFTTLKQCFRIAYPEGTFENANHAVIIAILSWLGFNIKEIVELKNDDVDLKNKIIYKNGKKFLDNINDDIIDILKKYKNTKIANRRNHKIELTDGKYFVKKDIVGGIIDDKNNKEHISIRLWNLAENYIANSFGVNKNITFRNDVLILSGKLNKLYQLEQSGETIDKIVIAKIFNIKNNSMLYVNTNDYMKLYEEYKEVYYN